ncbi:MAG: hypothetical protein GTO51_03535 [Candidatus Latescibacteria bacterium]|nr:hypothetical protein [Candidatus Latescibacterota bacterium]NIM20911.1 hypothetical protein [Candidatus Latescibacterota bacterium]NIM65046.1 hypothetical protein [Candidatus Latescibacterota bacterium]NIO01561.1 hypothetical protein [Candidatus Latescibacterota bacterium]NIO28078.1 hypothetical protein [Candidatus Latescibacterota bacterium]
MRALPLQQKNEMMVKLIAPALDRVARSDWISLPGDIGNHSRILVIDSGSLTELLFFSPVIKQLKSKFPEMRVSFLVREGNSELIRMIQQINEMISYEPSHLTLTSTTYFSLLKRLRQRDFNVVFLLGREFNFARSLLALITKAKIRVGFSQEFTYPFINCELRCSDDTSYEATRALSFLNAIGFGRDTQLPRWNLPEQDIRWARRMIHFRKPSKEIKLLAVDPGVGKGGHRLVDESFAYLVNDFCRRYPAKVLALSNNLESKGLERFKSLIVADLLGLQPANIKEGIALLSCADLMISGNTDYFHFAVNMNIPTIGLFTRHDDSKWLPRGTPWVQILQGVKGQQLSLEEFFSKIDTLFHLAGVK